MTHPLTRVRTDQVGSLLRPASLVAAFLDRGRGRLDDTALARAQDAAIRQVVREQEAHGLAFVTDGEYRRLNWQVSFSEVAGWDLWQGSWQGFVRNPSLAEVDEAPLSRGRDAVESFKVPATARLRLVDNFPLREFRFLQPITKAPAKAMLMGPDRVAQMCDIARSAPHYADSGAFLADVVAIQSRMVGELIDAGCAYVQLDEPSYTGYVDASTLARIAARGEDPLANLRRAIAASNAVIAAHAGRACFGLHICRGNRASMWHREGAYDGIAEVLFNELRFDRLLLEYDSERAGGFEPLRFVPRGGATVVLGLVTTKSGELESADHLMHRIDDAARYIDLEQLALSPQCGFASGISGNRLSMDEQWRKLDLINEVARRVWG
ncbi:MAG: 5-methyltetrahydropteroyltriglutamate--homocysteine S-methyltransferase [Burkholderiales bacterium]|nr:5-methyltetrahydropteroyltriglutamate--homocysteine S-methyltransferase [Burkholderiales bacterium]